MARKRKHWTQTVAGRKRMREIASLGGQASAAQHNGATDGNRRPVVVERIKDRIAEIEAERKELVTALDVHERYSAK